MHVLQALELAVSLIAGMEYGMEQWEWTMEWTVKKKMLFRRVASPALPGISYLATRSQDCTRMPFLCALLV